MTQASNKHLLLNRTICMHICQAQYKEPVCFRRQSPFIHSIVNKNPDLTYMGQAGTVLHIHR